MFVLVAEDCFVEYKGLNLMEFSSIDLLSNSMSALSWATPRQASPAIEALNTGPDFSAWAMFREASLVVQIVMVILIAASFWSWAIIVEKVWKFASLRKKFDAFEKSFWSGTSLDDLYGKLVFDEEYTIRSNNVRIVQITLRVSNKNSVNICSISSSK